MIPVGDENPTKTTPYVNYLIIGLCLITFLWQISDGDGFFNYTITEFGLIPARILSGDGYVTLFTNMFLHGGWTHLIGNMFFLYIFGDNVEDFFGHLGYLLFYFTSGVLASLMWMLTEWGAPYPAIGASGAISSVMAAYLLLFPNARIRTLISFGFFWRIIKVSASMMIGFWFLYQLLLAFLSFDTGVAYFAHIGGFIAGLILTKIFAPPRSRANYY
ncbi:MAG: rhomboid family intramembrane serine protease [Candidatus Bathyarchaeia archaeon]